MNTAATNDGSYSRSVQAPDAAPTASEALGSSAMPAWLARMQLAFDRWCESNAQARADARVWDIARSDPRVMADLMRARTRDDRDADNQPAIAPVAAPALQEETPVRQQPFVRVAGQGWGRMVEDAYQNRFHQPRPQHA